MLVTRGVADRGGRVWPSLLGPDRSGGSKPSPGGGRFWPSLLLSVLLASAAFADPMPWYNGDPDMAGGQFSSQSPNFNAAIFENFTVTGSGWFLTSIFGNFSDLANELLAVTLANFEIRQGASPGNGGTLKAQGVLVSATVTATAFKGFSNRPVSRVTVPNLNIFLDPGTYWISLQPTIASNVAYLARTSGAGGAGSPVGDGVNLFHSPGLGYNFSNAFAGDNFSLGITGHPPVVDPPVVDPPDPLAGVPEIGWEGDVSALGLLLGMAVMWSAGRPRRRAAS